MPTTEARLRKELEQVRLDYANLKMTTYDQAHSAGANHGYNNCREEMQPLIDAVIKKAEIMERQRDILLEHLLDELGMVDGEWLPHFDDYEAGKTYTKEEARQSWLLRIEEQARDAKKE